MGIDRIDSKLMELADIAEAHKTERNGFKYRWLIQSINWWIGTARASTEWLRMFAEADMQKLAEQCIGKVGADDKTVRAVTRFLKGEAK